MADLQIRCAYTAFPTLSQHYSLVITYIDDDTLNEDEKNVVDYLSDVQKSQREIDSFLDVHNDARKKKTVDSCG